MTGIDPLALSAFTTGAVMVRLRGHPVPVAVRFIGPGPYPAGSDMDFCGEANTGSSLAVASSSSAKSSANRGFGHGVQGSLPLNHREPRILDHENTRDCWRER